MATHNEIVEVESNVVKITTGGVEKEYNKTDLKCSATDIMVFLYYYTDSKNQIVASWNAYQANLYGYTLSSLKAYIDGLLSSSNANLSNINLGNTVEYASQTDAIAGGLKNGDVYRLPISSDNRILAIVSAVIQAYTAGTAPITFMPDGSNGWNIGIIAQPTTLQIPSGETIDSVAYEIKHFVGGTNTGTISGTLTSDDTINTGALGAGTFEISLLYHISDGSEVNTLYAFQVDATDVIIDYCKINGATVNSVSGLDISVSADVNSSVSTTVTWFSFDGGSNFIQVGTGVNATITMPLGAIYVVPVITLGSGFPDYPSNELSSRFSITIS
jgi:hypothetical protein